MAAADEPRDAAAQGGVRGVGVGGGQGLGVQGRVRLHQVCDPKARFRRLTFVSSARHAQHPPSLNTPPRPRQPTPQICNHPFCMPESEPDGEGNSPLELLTEASGAD